MSEIIFYAGGIFVLTTILAAEIAVIGYLGQLIYYFWRTR